VRDDGTPYEGSPKLHGNPLSKSEASYEKTVEKLGGDPKNPFVIFPDVKTALEKVAAEKAAQAALGNRAEEKWAGQNPEAARKLGAWLKNELPALDWSAVEQKPGEATRAASKNVLQYLAGKVENLIVMSADLADSDYTEGFLKKTQIFRKGDFSGAFLQAGVSELTMAGVMTGIALHGGCIPVGGTFFAFSDFQKPAIRLAAIMGAHVIYLWSHDAFRVGEDGPTHQPIEQEAQLRLLERIANLEGHRSFLAMRPGDAAETTAAWKLALEAHGPAAIVLTRQPVAELPAKGNRLAEAMQGVAKGAYVAVDCDGKPDLILLANGSEASLMVEGAAKLKDKGLKVRVVSAISEGLFRDQSESYRDSVLPFGLPVLGWTAGEPSTLRNLVGPLGKVYGMTRFGASAPFKVLDQKFGYTAENVVAEAEKYLAEYKAELKKLTALA
jgi:transketolase